MAKLVLVRHGQSLWNLENRFTGWVDVDLSEQGIKEAEEAGVRITSGDFNFKKAHCSRLIRAKKTLKIIMEALGTELPVWEDSALNERHYGELQGKNKDECREEFGADQVHIWRRSYDVPPPGGECLSDTAKRTLPYFREYILKDVKAGHNILVSAHGNSLRSIIMEIEQLSPEEILKVEIGTGVPYIYEIDSTGAMKSKTVLEN